MRQINWFKNVLILPCGFRIEISLCWIRCGSFVRTEDTGQCSAFHAKQKRHWKSTENKQKYSFEIF